MGIVLDGILWCIETTLQAYFMIIVVNVALYWCMHFELIGQGGETFKKFLKFLHHITEPVYAKMREKIKPISGFDVTPYALIIILMFILHIIGSIRFALVAQ